MTSEKYLIAIDLDGTMLKDDKTISTKTYFAIKEALKAGHEVAIATGRPYRASKMYYQQLGLKSPIVNFNGAYVHHPGNSGFATHHSPLELETARKIIETCRYFKVNNMMAEVADDVFLDDYDEQFIDLFALGGVPAAFGDLGSLLQKDPTSLLVYPKENHAAELKELLSGNHSQAIEQRSWGAPHHMIEIINTGNNKAEGLRKLTSHYNIPMENVIAFGDEDNDLEMLSEAGFGVAMGNAIDDLKDTANEVTLSNEEDGIAVYLNKKLGLSSISAQVDRQG